MAPIVGRTTKKVRLLIVKTDGGNPCIRAWEAYNDTTGEVLNVARGGAPPMRAGE